MYSYTSNLIYCSHLHKTYFALANSFYVFYFYVHFHKSYHSHKNLLDNVYLYVDRS